MPDGVPEPEPGRTGVPWGIFAGETPDLAARVRQLFEAHTQHVLATLTIIGSPRVSGAGVGWWGDEMWLAAPTGSPKARDLRSDARFALHSNPGDGTRGDAKVGGLAVELVAGGAHDALVEDAGLREPSDVFLLRLRTVRLAPAAHDRAASGVTRWRPGHGGHRH
ncbi:hypothetical protein [Sanguibacter sp. 25GB23B1]|uniref:hypothetical protein n=1 Tax=unclassified Sanguibacter TaxID=2645534 RepID=UPI0032AF5EBE